MKNILVAIAALLGVACCCLPGAGPIGPEVSNTPPYAVKIHAARGKIQPMQESFLPEATKWYNKEIKGRKAWALNCLKYDEIFQRMSELTLYNKIYIAGFAMHESMGCRMDVSDAAGGRGAMQLTKIPPSARPKAARALGIPVSELHDNTNPLHNVMTGVMVLDDYERQFKSRQYGIMAYNAGPGRTRQYLRRFGWNKGTAYPPMHKLVTNKDIVRISVHRGYTSRVIAAIAMMKKAYAGEPLERVDSLSVSDIPGFYPEHDGEIVFPELAGL